MNANLQLEHEGKFYSVLLPRLTPNIRQKAQKAEAEVKEKILRTLDDSDAAFLEALTTELAPDEIAGIQADATTPASQQSFMRVFKRYMKDNSYLLHIGVLRALVDVALLPEPLQAVAGTDEFWLNQGIDQLQRGYEFFRGKS